MITVHSTLNINKRFLLYNTDYVLFYDEDFILHKEISTRLFMEKKSYWKHSIGYNLGMKKYGSMNSTFIRHRWKPVFSWTNELSFRGYQIDSFLQHKSSKIKIWNIQKMQRLFDNDMTTIHWKGIWIRINFHLNSCEHNSDVIRNR